MTRAERAQLRVEWRRLEWRSLPRRMFTICSACGTFAYCGGRRRNAMKCSDCWAQAAPARRAA